MHKEHFTFHQLISFPITPKLVNLDFARGMRGSLYDDATPISIAH